MLALPCERRHHVLSDVRRQRYRGDRTRPGTGQSRARRPLHNLRKPYPPGPRHPPHSLPRGRSFQLSAVPVSAVLPGAGIAHGGSGGVASSRPAARALRHPAFHFRHAGQRHAGARAAAPLHHHAAWHRYHAGGYGPFVLSHHQVLDREVRWHHLHQRISAPANSGCVWRGERNPGNKEFRELRPLQAGSREGHGEVLCAGGRQTADPRFEFPAREARTGLRADIGGGGETSAGAPVDGRRVDRSAGLPNIWRASWAWSGMFHFLESRTTWSASSRWRTCC